VDHGHVNDRALIRRAEAAGISTSYRNWRGEETTIGAGTLAAILAALEGGPHSAATVAGPGQPASRAGPGTGDLARGGGPAMPPRREWGFTVQLYSVRSRASWGHGDLRDLADLAACSARDLGAGFVQVNPLHAAEPLPPVSPSPYLPMTRRFLSPLYLRIEDIPEYRALSAGDLARIEALAEPLRARNTRGGLIDRDAVWAAKRTALRLIYQVPLAGDRARDYQRFREREGAGLELWAAWCTLAERHGPDWRRWPAPLRDPSQGIRAARAGSGHPGDTASGPFAPPGFHSWLQWLADDQLAAAQRAATQAGMPIGIVTDLAVGAHPGGADAWASQGLLVAGLSAGAPPDEFNQRGQDWSQPPWHPARLAEARYEPLARLFAASLRHVGGLRVDHVMGLSRLWVIPHGMTPDRGAYLRYDQRASLSALAAQAAAARAVAIGEDLGTVDPAFRRAMRGHGILGTMMLWFARDASGRPLPPSRWRRSCMATVGTHDVPPAAAFLAGEQVAVRARLGLLEDPDAERDAAALALSAWLDVLGRRHLIGPGRQMDPGRFTAGLYSYLAQTPAMLIGVSLADAVGDRRPQNVPGTSAEYPNWQIPLCDGGGRAVLLEELPSLPLVRRVVTASRPPPGQP
jgi:4-alpha-glucanotransferase